MTASADPSRSTNQATAELLLAVDAGGTKTAAWLVDLSQSGTNRVLGRGRASGGNPLSVGFDAATRAVTEAIAAACSDANELNAHVSRLILSIAGAANEEVGKRFVEWVRSLGLAEQVAVVSDVLPVLAAGTPQCVGVALIAGTGSVAFGRNAEGKTQLCGGWGYLLGDEGSGYYIGRMGLAHALLNLERGSDLHPMAAELLTALGAKTIMQVTKAVYASPDPRATVASLAPIVVDFAERRLPEAKGIVDFASLSLANLVGRAADSLGFKKYERFSLAVGGGLLVNSGFMRKSTNDALEKNGMGFEMTVVNEALAGCVRLASPEFEGTLVNWQDA